MQVVDASDSAPPAAVLEELTRRHAIVRAATRPT